MLKKTLKKLIATALAVATVATTMVAPVSASTLTPKKSHSEAQITEYVDYFNDITDRYAFRPDGYVPVGSDGRYLFFVKHFSLKKASEFPAFSEGFSLL